MPGFSTRALSPSSVDREERPDIDSLYMAACQAFTGSGGWPTTLFLTREQLPSLPELISLPPAGAA
ncbi:MAG: DUF255 domain-containing protein [Evtepia gabavorous]